MPLRGKHTVCEFNQARSGRKDRLTTSAGGCQPFWRPWRRVGCASGEGCRCPKLATAQQLAEAWSKGLLRVMWRCCSRVVGMLRRRGTTGEGSCWRRSPTNWGGPNCQCTSSLAGSVGRQASALGARWRNRWRVVVGDRLVVGRRQGRVIGGSARGRLGAWCC